MLFLLLLVFRRVLWLLILILRFDNFKFGIFLPYPAEKLLRTVPALQNYAVALLDVANERLDIYEVASHVVIRVKNSFYEFFHFLDAANLYV